MKKLKKIKLFSIALIAIFTLIACEKDLYEDAIQQNLDKQINIKQISLEQFNSKLVQMKNKPEIEGFMVSSNSISFQNRASSGSEFEIITDDIKEITQGDYTSHTMYVKTPDTTNSIYNITIEEVNDNTSLFLTKYKPSNNWTITSNRNFEGNVITYRISGTTNDPLVLASLFAEAFEGLQEGGYNGIGAGSGGSSSSNSYPYNCNGIVQTTIIVEAIMCSQFVHWPWSPTESNCNAAEKAKIVTTYFYECIPDYTPVDGDTPGGGDTSGGGGTNSGNNNTGNISLTTIVGGPAPDTSKDPCKVFKEALDPLKQNLNLYINDLVAKHQQSVKNEVSYSFSKTPQYDPATDAYTAFGNHNAVYKDGGPTSVSINVGTRWYSSIHLHPKDQEEATGIFSWQDIRTFKDGYLQVTNDLKGEYSMMLVAPNPLNFNQYNVYALRINDINLLIEAINNEWNSSEWSNIADEQERLKAIQESLGDDYVTNKNNLAQFFLQKFSNYGISLFQLQNNQWKELVLNNTTNELEEKPCNN